MIDNISEELRLNGISVQEFNLAAEVGQEYWHTLFHRNGVSISGGFGSNKPYSRKIAYAEFLERSEYRKIFSSSKSVASSWGIDIIPTACGFAAGFDLENTIDRSLYEGVERWVMSKWIDSSFNIPETQPSFHNVADAELCNWFMTQFDKVRFFEKEVVVEFNGALRKVSVAQTMGFKGGGIYPGSSAQSANGNKWTHALLESFRHLLVVKNGNEFQTFPNNKIKFFSSNAQIAEEAIGKAEKLNWPTPKVIFHRAAICPDTRSYLARTIIDGWKSWHLGEISRFLY